MLIRPIQPIIFLVFNKELLNEDYFYSLNELSYNNGMNGIEQGWIFSGYIGKYYYKKLCKDSNIVILESNIINLT